MNNFLQKKIRKKISHTTSGFSILELMVSITIFTILTMALAVNQNGFNNRTNTDSLAHQIAQWIRDAQISSMGVRRSSGGSFDHGYGLHFTTAGGAQFVYFSDTNDNGIYDTGSDGVEETVGLLQGYKVTLICGQHSGIDTDLSCGGESRFTSLPFADISFRRPNPDALIKGYPVGGSDAYSPLRITITAPKGYTRTVVVYVTGQVSIE